MRKTNGKTYAAMAAAALAILSVCSAAQAVRPSLSGGLEVTEGTNTATVYAIGQQIRCVSATDDQTYLEGYVNIPDSVKIGKKSAAAIQKAYATIAVSLGDGVGGVVISGGPYQPATCAVSWSLADNDGDGDYDGGADELTMSVQCNPGELMSTMGFDFDQAASFLGQFNGVLGCSVSGVPAP